MATQNWFEDAFGFKESPFFDDTRAQLTLEHIRSSSPGWLCDAPDLLVHTGTGKSRRTHFVGPFETPSVCVHPSHPYPSIAPTCAVQLSSGSHAALQSCAGVEAARPAHDGAPGPRLPYRRRSWIPDILQYGRRCHGADSRPSERGQRLPGCLAVQLPGDGQPDENPGGRHHIVLLRQDAGARVRHRLPRSNALSKLPLADGAAILRSLPPSALPSRHVRLSSCLPPS
jgi:hypothetical protein